MSSAGGNGIEPVAEIDFRPLGKRHGRRRLPAPATIGILFLAALLSVALWFVFSARSVQIEITPQPGALTFSSGLQFRLGERFLTLPGSGRVTATQDGYFPLDQTILVTDEASQVFRFRLEKMPGQLVFELNEPAPQAVVRIDGEPIDGLRSEDLRPGDVRVEILTRRFKPWVGTVSVAGGGLLQRVAVELEPNWASVKLATGDVAASVLVDGESLGMTPGVFELIAGERQVELVARGYKRWERVVQIAAGVPLSFTDIDLQRADGTLTLVSRPSAAAVSVDGSFAGETPIDLKLRPNRGYQLAVSKAGFATERRNITVQADEDQRILLTLEPQLGEVRLDVRPRNARVEIGGRLHGTDAILRLPALPQVVRISAAGFVSITRTISPTPRFAQDLRVQLLTPEQDYEASLRPELVSSAGDRLKLIRPRPFVMGARRSEPGRRANEERRQISGLADFYLGSLEVTNAQFRAFRSSHKSGRRGKFDLDADNLPVVNVSWADAVEYCNWLSKKEGLSPFYQQVEGRWTAGEGDGYRLPDEAEWAFAARFAAGQDGRRFAWGSALPPPAKAGNFAGASAADIVNRVLPDYDDGYAGTAPVGSFAANAAGIFDMSGNVAEWTADHYAATPGAPPLRGRFRTVRGASYQHSQLSELRLAFRDYSEQARDDLGFRIARSVPRR